MSDAWLGLIGSIIVAVCGLIGVVVSNNAANEKMASSIKTAEAVTDTKIEALTAEVKKHNGFAEKIPVMQEQIKVINHRIDDLERGSDK